MTRSRTSLHLLLLSALCPLGLASACPASDEKEPYKIRIVIQMARHRLLTDVFREQVSRELKDGLQAALGDLAKVTVAEKHPRLEKVRRLGLVRALDNWNERSPYQTHFVQIDFTGTTYTIRTRQHDGLTGLPSPVVRRDRTRDRAYVGRTAALLIERDLGLLGTVESEPDAHRAVRVALKGGKLGVDLSRWVKKDEVFGLVRVQGASPGQPIPWAVLQVEEPAKDGVCVCRYYSRWLLPRVTGLRCVLLGTYKGPLRLRLMQEMPDRTLGPLDAPVTLQIRKGGFEGEEATRLQLSTNGGKDVDTSRDGAKGVFNRLAFVSVLTGDTLRARIPVPLVQEGVTVLPVPAGNEEGSLIAFRFRALQRNVFDSYQVQTDLFKEINDLTARPEKRAEALARVRQTLERSQQDHLRLTTEREAVGEEIKKLPDKDRPKPSELAAIDNRLKLLKSGEADLLKHITLLEKIEKEENDPKRKEGLIQIERAKSLEKEAEFGQAIAIYEKLPREVMTPALKKRLQELKRQWDTRDEKHADARRFIYRVWPKLNTTGLKDRITDAQKAFEVCKNNVDLVGPTKLLKETDKHVQRVGKELEALNPEVVLDDKKPAELIKSLLPELAKLVASIQEYLESRKD
jgi:hypothetical protein